MAAVGRRLFRWPAAAGLAGLAGMFLGLPWLAAGRVPSGPELLLAAVLGAVLLAASLSLRAERARVTRTGVGATAELARGHAIFLDELEQRLEVQRQLRESEARLRAIVDGAPIVLFAIDRSGVITFSAGTGPDPLGKRPGEAVGWAASELFAGHSEVVDGIRRALSGIGGQAALSEDNRFFSLSLAPFRDPAGQLAGAIAVAVDITERRRAEQALHRTVDALRQVDEERRALLGRLVRAQEEERRRIAGDIHDDSIQTLFAVRLRLHTLRATLGDAGHIQQVDGIQQTVETATSRLRHLLFELRPPALDQRGLGAALREYLDVMAEERALHVRLDSSLEGTTVTDAQVIAYRIAQEALANVRKHAQARRVECAVSPVDDGILIRIADDGAGFHAGDGVVVPGHLGLVAMRERAEMAGGRFRITSSPGNGCVVEYWIPDPGRAAAHAA